MKYLVAIVSIAIVLSCNTTQSEKSEADSVISKDLQDKYISMDQDKNNLQKQFDAVLLRLDSLTVYNQNVSERNADAVSNLTKTKAEVNRILLRDKLTSEEKQKADKLINEMNYTLNTINK